MHHRSWIMSIVLCALGWLATSTALADMRCEGKLVSEGDTQYEVRSRCGSPDQSTQRVEQRMVRRWVSAPCQRLPTGQVQCGYLEEQIVQVTVEEWLYDLGPHSLIRFLTFEQGRLVRVTTGSYGVKQI